MVRHLERKIVGLGNGKKYRVPTFDAGGGEGGLKTPCGRGRDPGVVFDGISTGVFDSGRRRKTGAYHLFVFVLRFRGVRALLLEKTPRVLQVFHRFLVKLHERVPPVEARALLALVLLLVLRALLLFAVGRAILSGVRIV